MTISLQTGFTVDGAAIASSSPISVTAAAAARIDGEAFAQANDQEMEIAFPYANIKGYILYSTVACTIETNSSSAPDDTITLAAGVPKTFITGGQTTNLFTDDVTTIFVSAAAAGALTMYVAYDPTP
jgi:hypothetical protein